MGQPGKRDLEALAGPFDAGEHERAAQAARKFTRRWPNHETGWATLGKSLYHLGRLDEAERALDTALRLAPATGHLHNDLALVLLAAGRPAEAENRLHAGLAAAPDDPGLLANLASALSAQQRPREAEPILRRALIARPNDARLVEGLAGTLRDQRRYAEAARQFRRAISLQPGAVRPRTGLGAVLRELGEASEAERAFRRAVDLVPDDATVHVNLGVALADQGRNEEALGAFRRAAELEPGFVAAHTGILAAKSLEPDDPDVAALSDLLRDPDLDERERARGHYAVGDALARLRTDPDTEWHHFATGAALRRKRVGYAGQERARHLHQLRTVFNDPPPDRSEADSRSPRPLFVVGMPRSGTTLLERILSSHPAIETAGERADVQRLVEATAAEQDTTYPAGFDALDTATLDGIAGAYRRGVLDGHPDARWVIDKQPDNHRHVGLLARALPEAVFLHVTREPADTCVSCFLRDFVAPWTDYTWDLAELGHYYRLYAELMAHWRNRLPAERLMETRYEAVVDDLEGTVGGVLGALGLEWDAACATFHRRGGAVTTSSKFQVRQPLYTGSIGRWRRYAHHLDPLFAALGPLAPTDAPAPTDAADPTGSARRQPP